MSLADTHKMMNRKNIPTLVDCGCDAIVWNDESGVEILYCPKHAAALAMFEALRDTVDLLSMLGHWDAGYCESCKTHAPKDEDGNLTGSIPHKEDCIIGNAEKALTLAETA